MERRISGSGGGEEAGVGVRLSSRRVSREERRDNSGEAPHAPLRRRSDPGVEGASLSPWPARRSSTGVWIPTERVLGGETRLGVGVGGVLDAVSWEEVVEPLRERRLGKGDSANCRKDAMTPCHARQATRTPHTDDTWWEGGECTRSGKAKVSRRIGEPGER